MRLNCSVSGDGQRVTGVGWECRAVPSFQLLYGGWRSAASVAGVAAPIRRLCVLYWEESYPNLCSRSCKIDCTAMDERGHPK